MMAADWKRLGYMHMLAMACLMLSLAPCLAGYRDLKVTGNWSLTFRDENVSGPARQGYYLDRWDTGPVRGRAGVNISGNVWKRLFVDIGFTRNGFSRGQERYLFRWEGDDTVFELGHLNDVGLGDNPYASFRKSLKGIHTKSNLGGGITLDTFYSQERGIVRRETIRGNDTPGPYWLRYAPILDGSETVKVDEQPQVLGVDYTLNYDTGMLEFDTVTSGPRIIPSTSTISVSYQSARPGNAGGALYGLHTAIPIKSGGQIGMTFISQRQPSANNPRDTARFQRDRWDGAGSTGPFIVRSRPIVRDGDTVIVDGQSRVIDDGLVVLLDNVKQIEGVDYLVNYDAGRIEFLRVVAPTSIVVADYYYRIEQTRDVGSKSVVGLDGSVPLGKHLTLTGQFGHSNAASIGSGSAMSIGLFGDFDRFKFQTYFNDVDPLFSRIETVGFQRDESGFRFNFGWDPNEFVSVTGGRTRSRSNQGYTFGYSPYAYSDAPTWASYDTGTTTFRSPMAGFSPTRAETRASSLVESYDTISTSTDLQVSVDYPGWPGIDIALNTLKNSDSSRGDSKYSSQSVDLDYSPASLPFSVRLALDRTQQAYSGGELAFGGQTASFAGSGSVTISTRSTVTYNDPSGKFSIATNWNTNKAKDRDVNGRNSNAQTLQVSANFNPAPELQLRGDYAVSQSNGTVASSLYSGLGSGYGIGWGGGYGSGLGGGYSNWGGSTGGFPGGYGSTIAGRWEAGHRQAGSTGIGVTASNIARNRYTSRQASFNATYMPNERFSLQLGLNSRLYRSTGSVGYAADSNFNRYDLGLQYRFESGLAISASLGRDTTEYLDTATGTISNNLFNLGLDYRPQGSPFSFGLSLVKMTGSSPIYTGLPGEGAQLTATSYNELSGRLGYSLGEGRTVELSIGRSRFNSGFDASARLDAALTFRYKLSRILSADIGYQLYRYDGEGSLTGRQSGDYTANILAASINASFQSGY